MPCLRVRNTLSPLINRTYHESFQALFKKLIRNPNPTSMFMRRKRVLNHIFHIQARPNLMKRNSQVIRFRIRKHNKLHACRGFVVVEFVFACSVGNEATSTISVSAECLEWKVYTYCPRLPVFARDFVMRRRPQRLVWHHLLLIVLSFLALLCRRCLIY